MTLEKSLWSRFRACACSQHLMRVENSVGPGTPDVNGCYNGVEYWVELKQADPPKKETSILQVRHFTTEQRRWLVQRIAAGGNAYVLIQVGREYLVLRGDVAALHLGLVPLTKLRESALLSTGNIVEAVRKIRDGIPHDNRRMTCEQ